MAYIYKQKLNIRELVDRLSETRKVLILEPETYACALYAYHLSAADYHVKACRSVDAVHEDLRHFSPHVLIINPAVHGGAGAGIAFFEKVRSHYPDLRIITVALAADHKDIGHFMALGVNAHLDRRSTRPEDIVHIVRTLIDKN